MRGRLTDVDYGRLSRPQRCMAILREYPGLTAQELADMLDIHPAFKVRDSLYAHRYRNPGLLVNDDSGGWYLTAEGIAHVDEVRRRIDAYHAKVTP